MAKFAFLLIMMALGVIALIILKPIMNRTPARRAPGMPLSFLDNRMPIKQGSGEEDDGAGGGSARAPDKLKDEKFRERTKSGMGR